jgi:hypothetical protein
VIELALLLRCRPADVLELEDVELATLVDVLGGR